MGISGRYIANQKLNMSETRMSLTFEDIYSAVKYLMHLLSPLGKGLVALKQVMSENSFSHRYVKSVANTLNSELRLT